MSTTFSTESAAAWEEEVSARFWRLAVVEAGERFEGTLTAAELGDGMTISQVTNTASVVARKRGAEGDASDDLLLLTPLAGGVTVRQDDFESRVTRGMVSVHVADRPYELDFDAPATVLVLHAPRSLAPAPLLTPAHANAARARRSPLASVFRAFLEEALEVSAQLSAADAQSLSPTASSLALSLLSAGTEDNRLSDPTAIALRAQAFARAHLGDEDLTPAKIAAHLHVSLRYLQLAFTHLDTSPARFIRTERINRADTLLRDPRFQGMSVGQIAAMVGYDAGTFIRAYRRQLGRTPGALRAAG